MKIGRKLNLGFFGIALLTVIIGVIGIYENLQSQNIINKEIFSYFSELDNAWILMESLGHQQIAAKEFIFMGSGLKGRRADYFFEKERMEKSYHRIRNEDCPDISLMLKRFHKNMRMYNEKIEQAFELHNQKADLETIKEKVKQADKFAEIAHEEDLEPLINHIHKDHIEPAKQEIEAAMLKNNKVVILIGILAFLLAIILGFLISRSISVPIIKLKTVAAEIGEGNFDIRAEVNSKDEIGDLGASFNEMADSLEKKQNELSQIYNCSPNAMRVVDKDFNIISQNKAMSILTGIEQPKGVKCSQGLKGNLCNTKNCILTQILEGKELIDIETEKINLDGESFPCRVLAAPFKDIKGNLLGMIEVFLDQTEIKCFRKKEEFFLQTIALADSENKKAEELKSLNEKLSKANKKVLEAMQFAEDKSKMLEQSKKLADFNIKELKTRIKE